MAEIRPPTMHIVAQLQVGETDITTETRFFIRPPKDHPIYNLVGQVASEWAHFEHALDRIIWALGGVSESKGAVSPLS